MGKRPSSILKRAQQNEPRPGKKQKTKSSGGGGPEQPRPQQRQQGGGGGGGGSGSSRQAAAAGLRPTSAVHSQAAFAVRRLLEADERKRGGVSLKSLTLAPHITAKKATYAVTVETLKHLPVLLPLLERTQLVEQGRGLTQSVALVLAYEILWGEGLRSTGLAERAVLARKVGGGMVGWAAGHVDACWVEHRSNICLLGPGWQVGWLTRRCWTAPICRLTWRRRCSSC